MKSAARSGPYFVGADLGASWLRVAVVDARGAPIRRARLAAVPPREAAAALARQLAAWGLRPAALVLGSTRLGRASDRARVRRALLAVAPRARVLADLELAWAAALGGAPGVLLLSGTGSVAYGRDACGHAARVGGLGPLLGDEGSAFWIGREWLRTRPEREALAFAHRADPVRAVAALATRVLWAARSGRGAERRAARRIAARAQQALALQARAAAGRLHFSGPAPLSWHGGLLRDADFRAGVLSRLGRRLRPSPPREEPPLFAARMALGFARMGRSWHSSARSAARAR